MKSGNTKEAFRYENLHLNTTDINKWYVGYTLIFDADGRIERRREHGKSRYDISLTKEKDLGKREKLGNKLKSLVQHDLDRGVDPLNRAAELENQIRIQKELAKKEEEAKISIDQAIQLTAEAKGWINPVPSKERTATSLKSFFKNQFKPFVISINKHEDVRRVTRIDIKDFIDMHFNPKEGSGYSEWSASSCAIYKAWTSIMFSVLLDKDLISVNPCIGIKSKNDSEKIIQKEQGSNDNDSFEPWTDTEVKYWFRDLKNGAELDKLVYAASHALHYSFIRGTEMLRLKVWMCDFENERLTIPPAATKSARKYSNKNLISIDMPDALVLALKEWTDYKYPNGFDDDDYLFPSNLNSTKQQFSYSMFTKLLITTRDDFKKRYTEQGLYIGKKPYALKHSGVIKLFKALSKSQKTPQQIQQIIKEHCRHSSFTTTETYLRRLKLDFDVTREKVNF